MRIADPTALAVLVTVGVPTALAEECLCWLSFILMRCYWNLLLLVQGRWCGAHKMTI
ncbi:MAG: hypothetical protein ACRERE_00700 [Candidatus Entotheonellia bacterium]